MRIIICTSLCLDFSMIFIVVLSVLLRPAIQAENEVGRTHRKEAPLP
ncbi:MAG TPA: hypothetical protein PKN92_11500 [Candidatus Hydrogenedentes bacterium]|nr:hypothetical protein [Candidatus Hydrogenedentota bacterium]